MEELLCLSRLAGLEVTEGRAKPVLENLQRMAQVAQVVNSVELAPDDEIGPEWRP
jgi:Asp-tRNA(Asn)/Glu-tRNA(Gln) amidotransferase C subunit